MLGTFPALFLGACPDVIHNRLGGIVVLQNQVPVVCHTVKPDQVKAQPCVTSRRTANINLNESGGAVGINCA